MSEEPAAARVNAQFHAAYDDARADAERNTPVLVVLANVLVVCTREAREEIRFLPPLFDLIKSVAHAPVAVFAACIRTPSSLGKPADAAHDPATSARLSRMLTSLNSLEASLAREGLPASTPAVDRSPEPSPRTRATLLSVVRESRGYLEGVLRDEPSRTSLQSLVAFAESVGPALLRTTEEATRVELASMHEAVSRILEGFDEDARRSFEVVVAGAHQARVRSLGMQYFGKLLGEVPGSEQRLTYAEGAETADEAVALVGTRRLDRVIAKAFFGDERRLQRDVLGDAVKAQLAAFDLGPSVPVTPRGTADASRATVGGR